MTEPSPNAQPNISPSYRKPLVTTRIGLIFVGVATGLFVCATAANLSHSQPKFQSLMWVAALATCCLGGLLAMSSVRTLSVIENELGRRTDASRQWQSSRPIVGADPVTDGWNELLEDVRECQTEQPRHAAQLDQETITLARAMRGLPVPWVITDPDGNVRYLGPAACNLLDLNEDESHVGRDLLELLGLRPAKDCQAAEAVTRLLGPIRMIHERRNVEICSRSLHLRITRTRLSGRSHDGEGLGWLLTDMTQQHVTTQARDQFLMTATHELRTPLNNLQAYAETLLEEEDLAVERQKEFCNVINSEANRLGRLVDQLLTVSQMEAGSMVANRHELELLPMLEYAADQLRGQAEQKQISLSSNLSAKLPTIFGDRDKLQAAMVNLVGNAVKYTPDEGQVTIRCSADDRWIRIEVEDDGPGIPDDEQSKVFDKFFRGAATRDLDQRGNGLGLAFAREIAKLHGGEIDLHSVVGEGSVFTLRLPVGGRPRSGL